MEAHAIETRGHLANLLNLHNPPLVCRTKECAPSLFGDVFQVPLLKTRLPQSSTFATLFQPRCTLATPQPVTAWHPVSATPAPESTCTLSIPQPKPVAHASFWDLWGCRAETLSQPSACRPLWMPCQICRMSGWSCMSQALQDRQLQADEQKLHWLSKQPSSRWVAPRGLQLVLMRHPPSYQSKLGGGGSWGGGGGCS